MRGTPLCHKSRYIELCLWQSFFGRNRRKEKVLSPPITSLSSSSFPGSTPSVCLFMISYLQVVEWYLRNRFSPVWLSKQSLNMAQGHYLLFVLQPPLLCWGNNGLWNFAKCFGIGVAGSFSTLFFAQGQISQATWKCESAALARIKRNKKKLVDTRLKERMSHNKNVGCVMAAFWQNQIIMST